MVIFWTIKTIYKSINMHPLFIIICLISVMAGMFRNIYFFSLLIIIHEIGHASMGLLMGWDLSSIDIYPYGGCTKFNNEQNVSLFKELLVLLAGPILQIAFYILIKDCLSFSDYILLKKYNFLIIFFNLLPIYPLDGGKLLNLFLCLFFPYKRSLYISIYLSFFMWIIMLFKVSSLSFFIVLIFILISINRERNNISLYYYRFIIERAIRTYYFKKTKIIDSINKFYRGRRHIVRLNNRYYFEKDFLNLVFTNECKK